MYSEVLHHYIHTKTPHANPREGCYTIIYIPPHPNARASTTLLNKPLTRKDKSCLNTKCGGGHTIILDVSTLLLSVSTLWAVTLGRWECWVSIAIVSSSSLLFPYACLPHHAHYLPGPAAPHFHPSSSCSGVLLGYCGVSLPLPFAVWLSTLQAVGIGGAISCFVSWEVVMWKRVLTSWLSHFPGSLIPPMQPHIPFGILNWITPKSLEEKYNYDVWRIPNLLN